MTLRYVLANDAGYSLVFEAEDDGRTFVVLENGARIAVRTVYRGDSFEEVVA